MRATPLVRRMSVVLGDDVIRARVAANLRSVSVLVLDSVIGAGEGDLAGGLHLGGIRGAGAVALGGGDRHAGNGGEGRGSCLDDALSAFEANTSIAGTEKNGIGGLSPGR